MPFDESLLEPVESGFDPSLLEPIEIPNKVNEEQEQAEILSRPAVPAYITEHNELPGEAGLQSTSTPWQRFRASELGHKIFGPTDIEREASPDLRSGGMGLLEIPQKALQFTSIPPQIANPIRQEIDDALARTDQSPKLKGLIKGGAELVLNLPLAPFPVFPKTVLAAFGTEYAWHLPEQKKAYNAALERGDLEEATKIATQTVGGGALLAFGAAHSAIKSESAVKEALPKEPTPVEPIRELGTETARTDFVAGGDTTKPAEPAVATPAVGVEQAAPLVQEIKPDTGIAASARQKLAERPNEDAFIAAGPIFQALAEKRDVVSKELSGHSAPRTSTASETSGNKLVRYASARIAAPEVAKYMATEVLGDNYKDVSFSQKLGAILVEDRLRAIKDSFTKAGKTAEAGKVNSVIGQKWSPFATEAEYQAALSDPAILDAITRHKNTVQPTAQLFHEEAGGELAGPGLQTGAFVNLKATDLSDIVGGASRGNLQNPLRRTSRFSKRATGSAEQYELDYRSLAERMISSNFEEYAKRQWYEQMVTDGLAVLNDPGTPIADFGGKKGVRIPIDRKGVPAGGGAARTYVKYLDVRADLAPEVRQALNTDGAVGNAAIVRAANILNQIQLAGPTDAVWHTANMISSIAGSQGGKNVLIDLARQMPGVNLGDAITRVVASGIKVLRDTPEIQKELAQIAEVGALRSEREASKFAINQKLIGLVDKAGRLVRNEMYQNLVDRGLIKESEAGRREFINQMGNYNTRLMGQFQRFFKEAGFSPFVVAGRNFNRAAWRRLTLSPGIKAASPLAAAEMRAINFFGLVATLVAIPSLINLATTGNPSGRPGVKFGQIDTGKDRDGKPVVIDPAQWTGLRRGLRISGAQAVIEGIRQDEPARKITRNAIKQQLGGILHPWSGPAVEAVHISKTGESVTGFRESENPYDYGENLKAALKQLNPVAESIIEGRETGKPISNTAFSLAGAFGLKEVQPFTAQDNVRNLANQFISKSNDPKLKHDWEKQDKERFISDYKDLREALEKNDLDKAVEEYKKLLAIRKKPIDIQQVIQPFTETRMPLLGYRAHPKPFVSLELEPKFLASLTPEQRKIYDAALAERKVLWERFQKMLAMIKKS